MRQRVRLAPLRRLPCPDPICPDPRQRTISDKTLIAALTGSAALLAAALLIQPVFAAGGGSSSSSSSGSGGAKKTCPTNWKYNPATGKCQRSTSNLQQELPAVGWNDVDQDFIEAAVLAHSGQYKAAISALEALHRPDDPYVLNYLGFSNRKLGQTETALAFYHKALSLRPDYVRARSYLGEGYVALGRIDDAREQLALIAEQCGTNCDEYVALDRKISEHLAGLSG